MEERLLAQAGAAAAPRLTRAAAARALGAGPARAEDTLAGRAQEIRGHHPERTRLTAGRAAAVLSVLTDGRRVLVLNAPAGPGKTRVLTEAAGLWAAAGRLVGIAPSQPARNTLAAGVPESSNAARFLGHACPASAAPAARSPSPRTWTRSRRDHNVFADQTAALVVASFEHHRGLHGLPHPQGRLLLLDLLLDRTAEGVQDCLLPRRIVVRVRGRQPRRRGGRIADLPVF